MKSSSEQDVLEEPVEGVHFDKDPAPYSVFSSKEQYVIALVCGMSGFWSAISGNIYYPIIVPVQKEFNISAELANVSVVMYFILQGIAPMFTASMADTIGRKPVVLACCVIYIAACCGIAKANVYWLILVLRCVQAAGIAPVTAINTGVCADLAPRATRGSIVGFTSGIQLLAMALGALVGSLLASGFDSWRAVFWFLAIGCGVSGFISFLILPETMRSMVGNGSIPPLTIINKSPLWTVPHFKKKLTNDTSTLEPPVVQSPLSKILDVPSIIALPEVFMVLIPTALYFTTWTLSLTALSTVLQNTWGYSVQRVGLCFLAPGIAGCFGSIGTGRLLNQVYKYYYQMYEKDLHEWEKKQEGPKPFFNLFKCRLSVLLPLGIIFNGGVLIFGWCLGRKQPLASVLIGSFLLSLVTMAYAAAAVNLLADLYPSKTSTSTACVNFTRCLFAAAGVASLDKMEEKMTIGGCFTFLAGLCLLSLIPIWLVIHIGPNLIEKRKAKKEQKSKEAEA